MRINLHTLAFFLILLSQPLAFGKTDALRWWPKQKAPRALVKTTSCKDFETVKSPNGKVTSGNLGANHMLVQSIAGLVAQAVNEGKCDELVWITVGKFDESTSVWGSDYADWYKRVVKRLKLEEKGTFTPWQLVKRYQDKGIIKGYILYSFDYSPREMHSVEGDVDESVNVATVVSGLTGGILIEEGQQAKARELGLEKLFDARGKTMAWCFKRYKEKLNKNLVVALDTKLPHTRAMAIAHRTMVVYGIDEPVPSVMAWLDTGSAVIGWGGGDEFKQTLVSTVYGHTQTASNWCYNIPVLSAETQDYQGKKIKTLDPRTIDFSDNRSFTSFVMTDGDNIQWFMGDFCRTSYGDYWDNPYHGQFPFTWTSCVAALAQACPETIDYFAETQPETTSFIEFGGGYYYPDLFNSKREDKNAMAAFAKKIAYQMKKSGVNVLSFNCQDVFCDETRRACETFAREVDDLLGIVLIQYTPYNAGDGKIFWVKNNDGIEIPVVTCKYSIWGNVTRPRSGTPAKIARLINEQTVAAESKGEQAYSWTMVHCWSRFKEASGTDEDAENIKSGDKPPTGRQFPRGVTPVKWCVDRIDAEKTKVVTIDELLWRIRMEHNPQQTKAVIAAVKRCN